MGLRRGARRTVATAAAAAAAVGLAGCLTSPDAAAHPRLLGPTSAQREAAAVADATTLLARAATPPGAVAAGPLGAGVPGIQPASVPGDPDIVDLHREAVVQRVPGDLRTLRPRGATLESTGYSNTGESSVTFAFPPTRRLDLRWVQYTFQRLDSGGAVVRIDAQVTWVPRKPVTSLVAKGASSVDVTSVTVSTSRTTHATRSVTTTRTVIDPVVIARLTRAVNTMPAAFPGVRHCPVSFGGEVSLAFHRTDWPHPYAVVVAQKGGCSTATVTQRNRSGRRTSTAVVSAGSLFAAVDTIFAHPL